MLQSKNNPDSNKIGLGIKEADIEEAIKKSGYPLQTKISQILNSHFSVTDEWCYIDSKTKDLRTIDLLANRTLFEFKNENQPRVRPSLDLLIECKQSELPFIFFLSNNKILPSNYPSIFGLFHDSIKIVTDDDNSSYTLSIQNCLEANKLNFLTNEVPVCYSFSKCARNGKDIVLSGTESYMNLVLPLIKALQHYQTHVEPPKTAFYFDCHLCLSIGVIDGPMIGVTTDGDSYKSELIPWLRVLRNESYEYETQFDRQKVYTIDIVHKDYFNEYITNHLLPYANKMSDLIIKHAEIIAEGKAFAKGMGKDWVSNIESRLEKNKLYKRRIFPKIIR